MIGVARCSIGDRSAPEPPISRPDLLDKQGQTVPNQQPTRNALTGHRLRPQMRQPRLAELVANKLRDDILDGRLREGDSLPRQEDLLADFNVSLPAVREALRILENEGLVSVRRGNVGGATVHLPTAQRIAYMTGLVLQSQQTELSDVGGALSMLEPACAALCAERGDRHVALIPTLNEIIVRQAELIDDADVAEYNREARRFHSAIVDHCGNETTILVVGALQTIWSAHERRIYDHAEPVRPTLKEWRASQREHEKIATAIDVGDATQAARLLREHLGASQAFSIAADQQRPLSASLLA